MGAHHGCSRMTDIVIVTGDIVDSGRIRDLCLIKPGCSFSHVIKRVYNSIAWDFSPVNYIIYRGDSFWGAFTQHPEYAMLSVKQFQERLYEAFAVYGIPDARARFALWYGDVDTSSIPLEMNLGEAFTWSDKTLIQMKATPSIMVETNVGDSFTYEELL